MSLNVTGKTADAHWRTEIDAAGHTLVADEPASLGGADAGPEPFALVLAGLAACTVTTLRMYAEHKGWDGVQASVTLQLDKGEGDRRSIRRKVSVAGAPDEAALTRLRDIVERTPVTLALKAGFDILTHLETARDADDARLDEALEETFPASDPIAP
ncbi:MAG: OsmC family protein [Caulobacteraceae bacterium]|jgi:putative redox protein